MNKVDRIKRLRNGGGVRRCHIHQHPGTDYTVGQHSYDSICILLALYPDAPREVIVAILYHDQAEYDLGDIPTHVKWDNPELYDAIKQVEDRINEKNGWDQDKNLNHKWRSILKQIDLLELGIWSLEQQKLGWDKAGEFIVNIDRWFNENIRLDDSPVFQTWNSFLSGVPWIEETQSSGLSELGVEDA